MGILQTIVAAAIAIVTFIVIDAWMISTGVNPTVAAIIAAAAVFGEIIIYVKISGHRPF